jgi:hypothetical protein
MADRGHRLKHAVHEQQKTRAGPIENMVENGVIPKVRACWCEAISVEPDERRARHWPAVSKSMLNARVVLAPAPARWPQNIARCRLR